MSSSVPAHEMGVAPSLVPAVMDLILLPMAEVAWVSEVPVYIIVYEDAYLLMVGRSFCGVDYSPTIK